LLGNNLSELKEKKKSMMVKGQTTTKTLLHGQVRNDIQ
jgi:hypothetical protein